METPKEKEICKVCKQEQCKCELYTGELELDPLMVQRILEADKIAEAEDGLQSQKTTT